MCPTASQPSLECKLGLCSERLETNHPSHDKSNCIRATPCVCIWEEKQIPQQCMIWGSSSLWYQMGGVASSVCTPAILTPTNGLVYIPLAALNTMTRKKILHLPETETTNSTILLVTFSSHLHFHSQCFLS